MEFVTSQSDTTFVAYNGARFDHYFLVNSLMKLKHNIDYKSFIEADGRLLGFKFGDNNKIWDLCLFTLESLSKVAKSYGCDNQKGEFNHELIKSFSDVSKHHNKVSSYLVLDVVILKDCFVKFANMMYKLEKLDFVLLLVIHMGALE
jgi:hypothetical protein